MSHQVLELDKEVVSVPSTGISSFRTDDSDSVQV